MKPEVQRPRLRPAVWYAFIGAVIALVFSATTVGLYLLDPPVRAPAPMLQPEQCQCSRTLYYYDMAPFVRERVWCDSMEVGELQPSWPVVR